MARNGKVTGTGGSRSGLLRALATSICVVAATALVAVVAVAVFWFHVGIRPVLSGSMRPTYGPGWAIVTRPIPVSAVRPGDIIVFTPPGLDAQFAHRVTSVSGSPAHPVVTTKGDANASADPWHARIDGSTVPQVVGEVPWLGRVIVFVKGQLARVLLVVLVGLGTCLMGTRAILGRPSRTAKRASYGFSKCTRKQFDRKQRQPVAI